MVVRNRRVRKGATCAPKLQRCLDQLGATSTDGASFNLLTDITVTIYWASDPNAPQSWLCVWQTRG